jgi:hypothetical protein
MDWQLATTRNRDALVAIVVALMASVGLSAGRTLSTLPHFLYHKALLILRQAESAVRRLIMIAARALTAGGYKPRKPCGTLPNFSLLPSPAGARVPRFNLIDPLKIFSQDPSDAGDYDAAFEPSFEAANLAPIPATSLSLRLLALKHALDSIPQQAKRLARWYAQRDFALAQNQPHRLSPLRPGPPPASRQRKRKRTEMDAVLSECHTLAIYARDMRDSS